MIKPTCDNINLIYRLKNKIKMEQIPLFKVNMCDSIEDYIIPTLKSGMITQGKKVDEFEESLKKYFNYPYILTLNSATSGLTFAYNLLKNYCIDEYFEVISTPLTCFATNSSILANDLNIIWADTDSNTNNINLNDVKNNLKYNTRVLSFVHWGGVPVDLDKVNEIKEYYKNTFGKELFVVEDCAHAFGTEFNGKKLGTHGNISVFSLQAIKHLTTGDGGLIFLPNKELYEKAKLLRWFGIDRERRSLPGSDFRLEPDIQVYGFKYHMNDINASIGLANIVTINEKIQICNDNGNFYNKELQNIPGLELFKTFENSKPSYWIYTLKILGGRKNDFIKFMKDKNIVTSQVHARNDTHSCLKKYKRFLPILNMVEKEIVSIPVGWWVTNEQRQYIVDSIKKFMSYLEITTLTSDDIQTYINLIYQINSFKKEKIVFFDDVLHSIYILKIDNKIVSTARLLIEKKLYEPIGHIEDVVTDEAHRSKGYGKILINYLKNIAFNKFNCYKIVLNCKPSLEKFYTSCGMEKTGYSFSLYKN